MGTTRQASPINPQLGAAATDFQAAAQRACYIAYSFSRSLSLCRWLEAYKATPPPPRACLGEFTSYPTSRSIGRFTVTQCACLKKPSVVSFRREDFVRLRRMSVTGFPVNRFLREDLVERLRGMNGGGGRRGRMMPPLHRQICTCQTFVRVAIASNPAYLSPTQPHQKMKKKKNG